MRATVTVTMFFSVRLLNICVTSTFEQSLITPPAVTMRAFPRRRPSLRGLPKTKRICLQTLDASKFLFFELCYLLLFPKGLHYSVSSLKIAILGLLVRNDCYRNLSFSIVLALMFQCFNSEKSVLKTMFLDSLTVLNVMKCFHKSLRAFL